MSITFGNKSKGSSDGAAGITVSHNNAAGDFLLVAFGRFGTGLVKATGVTFNGDALTKIVAVDGTNNTTIELWYMVNPDIATGNIVVSYPSGSDHWLIAQSLIGVNLSDPIRGFESAAASSTSISDTIASAVGDLVIDGCTLNATTGAPNENAGQTLIDKAGQSASISVSGGMSYEAGAASNTLGWSWTGTVDSCLALVSIKPKPSVGGAIIF